MIFFLILKLTKIIFDLLRLEEMIFIFLGIKKKGPLNFFKKIFKFIKKINEDKFCF